MENNICLCLLVLGLLILYLEFIRSKETFMAPIRNRLRQFVRWGAPRRRLLHRASSMARSWTIRRIFTAPLSDGT